MNWIWFAVGSVFFGGLIAILAKLGVVIRKKSRLSMRYHLSW
ncbi:Uncharacterised protein [Actinobacillus seminis]|uniref:Uncharacterized protein n=1 Tax=Actinobacillus seminis TaxID=722 RepID=A0A380VF21_9PAST|nr:hypothetical protein [Actinobacillus seminis]SUU36161.1 Uncharacterised protein [Actinobacillus seminis]